MTPVPPATRTPGVLEAGDYDIFVGTDVRSAQQAGTFSQGELRVTAQLQEACAPVTQFDRLVNKDGQKAYQPVPLAERSLKERNPGQPAHRDPLHRG